MASVHKQPDLFHLSSSVNSIRSAPRLLSICLAPDTPAACTLAGEVSGLAEHRRSGSFLHLSSSIAPSETPSRTFPAARSSSAGLGTEVLRFRASGLFTPKLDLGGPSFLLLHRAPLPFQITPKCPFTRPEHPSRCDPVIGEEGPEVHLWSVQVPVGSLRAVNPNSPQSPVTLSSLNLPFLSLWLTKKTSPSNPSVVSVDQRTQITSL
ncbi:unnamed protein product [Pleuronectes platessa]|uniref:Uncharacterized protein n=1 Tax=Pleuronectes platessa TaxID=8262 RepID=A0A9N7VQS1_PLEPL|nr:unnamed protein product [Pleuronectes platessa]